MNARNIDPGELSPSEIDAWRQLLSRSYPLGNAFLDPSFAQAAARSYPGVRVCTFDADSGPAFLAYQYAPGLGKILRAAVRVGEEMSDYFGLIAHPSFHIESVDLLRKARLDYLYFTHLVNGPSAHGLSGERSQTGLRICLPLGGESYWAGLDATDPKFAKDTERRERKAIKDLGALTFSIEEVASSSDLDFLIEQKRAQYSRTGKGDWLDVPGRVSLLHNLRQATGEHCKGVLSKLTFGDTWAAMHFGLRSGKTLHYWFPVYNPDLSSLAPGRLLLRNIILNAASRGIEVIDRGLGETQAKNDFPSERHTFHSGDWHVPGFRSFSYRALQSLRWRISKQGALAGDVSETSV